MKRIVTLAAPAAFMCVVVLCATSALPACHNGTSGHEQNEREAVIVGTVVDASTGKPVGFVRVEGPGGHKTSTDEYGRFRLEGLESGATGEVKATASDGRTASVPLRPLAEAKLEIVLYLKRP